MKKIYFMLLCGIYSSTQPSDKKPIGYPPTNFLKMSIDPAAAKEYRRRLALEIKEVLNKPDDDESNSQMTITLSKIKQLPK